MPERGSPPLPQEKFECKNSLENFSPLSIFWDRDGILLIDYLPNGQTINVQYYSSLPVQSTDILKEERLGKLTKVVLFLHDKAPAYRTLATQKKLAYRGFLCVHHPPYSPDLAPADCHLLPGLKKRQLMVAIFRPKRRSLPPRRPGWTDNILIFE
jgi:histone-lysine N-methyltransferase SETMAR